MFERLTARSPKINLAYLAKVKENEQDVESPYPNTLKCVFEGIQRLAAYEDSGLSPERVQELAEAEAEGRLVELPCKVGDVIYETLHIHKCGICPNNRIGKCKYDGQDVECKDSKWSIGEIEFSLEMFSLHTGKLKRGLFLTREAAEKAIAEVG